MLPQDGAPQGHLVAPDGSYPFICILEGCAAPRDAATGLDALRFRERVSDDPVCAAVQLRMPAEQVCLRHAYLYPTYVACSFPRSAAEWLSTFQPIQGRTGWKDKGYRR